MVIVGRRTQHPEESFFILDTEIFRILFFLSDTFSLLPFLYFLLKLLPRKKRDEGGNMGSRAEACFQPNPCWVRAGVQI